MNQQHPKDHFAKLSVEKACNPLQFSCLTYKRIATLNFRDFNAVVFGLMKMSFWVPKKISNDLWKNNKTLGSLEMVLY